MRVRITVKDPEIEYDLEEQGLNPEQIKELRNHWFKWGEYLTLEIDTEYNEVKAVKHYDWSNLE